MKLRCNDNIVRKFAVSKYVHKYDAMTVALYMAMTNIGNS